MKVPLLFHVEMYWTIYLGGLGQVLKFKGEYIYIYDPINLHDTSKGKHYDVTPTIGGHEGASLIGGYLDISAGDIKWNATSTSI